MDVGSNLNGFEMTFILFWSGSQWVDFEMLLIGLPVDSGKDLGWTPNCHCKVRFPGRILKCFWSGSPLMLEGHCMGFRLNLLWFAEFSIDSEMFLYDSPSILKGLCRDAPLTLERFGMDFDWFWNVFDRILHSFWKDLWWIPNYFLSWGFWSDSSLILQCFWSGSPLILNWLRMDPPLTLTGLGLDCQLILQGKLHETHKENAV